MIKKYYVIAEHCIKGSDRAIKIHLGFPEPRYFLFYKFAEIFLMNYRHGYLMTRPFKLRDFYISYNATNPDIYIKYYNLKKE